MAENYLNPGPSRKEIDLTEGPLVLEFGVDWCPHCKAGQPLAEEILNNHPEIKFIQVEDGKGRRLGRSFQVKLWPTFIFLKDGKEVSRTTRPLSPKEISNGVEAII